MPLPHLGHRLVIVASLAFFVSFDELAIVGLKSKSQDSANERKICTVKSRRVFRTCTVGTRRRTINFAAEIKRYVIVA